MKVTRGMNSGPGDGRNPILLGLPTRTLHSSHHPRSFLRHRIPFATVPQACPSPPFSFIMSASAPRDSSQGASLLSQNTNPSNYGSISDDDRSSFHSTSTHEATPPQASTSTNTRRRRRKLPKPVLNLVNSGSVARDHLASERTFLAYVRTSLAISSMGVGMSIPHHR
jgi:hypothetical protein